MKILKITLVCTVLYLTYLLTVGTFISFYFPEVFETEGFSSNVRDIREELTLGDTGALLSMFFFAALAEEFLYRWFPLIVFIIIIALLQKSRVYSVKVSRWIFYLPCIMTSIIFGLNHGNAMNIIIQGVGGLFYSVIIIEMILYQKKEGDGRFSVMIESTYYGTIISTVSHATVNCCLALLVIMLM